MPIVQRTVYECDACSQAVPQANMCIFPAGCTLRGKTFPHGAMFCPACLQELMGVPPKVEYRESTYQSSDDRRGGGGGATGRPFVMGERLVVAEATTESSWCTLPPASSSSTGCAHGLARWPSGSGARSTWSARLSSFLIRAT